MGCALVEVRDVKEYVTGLEVSPTERCSLLEGLSIYSQSSDHLELAHLDTKEEISALSGRDEYPKGP